MERASTYTEVAQFVRDRKSFTHSSCSGYMIKKGQRPGFPLGEHDDVHAQRLVELIAEAVETGDTYVMVSYSTPVSFIREDGSAVITAGKYSSTSSKHANMVKDSSSSCAVAV